MLADLILDNSDWDRVTDVESIGNKHQHEQKQLCALGTSKDCLAEFALHRSIRRIRDPQPHDDELDIYTGPEYGS